LDNFKWNEIGRKKDEIRLFEIGIVRFLKIIGYQFVIFLQCLFSMFLINLRIVFLRLTGGKEKLLSN